MLVQRALGVVNSTTGESVHQT